MSKPTDDPNFRYAPSVNLHQFKRYIVASIKGALNDGIKNFVLLGDGAPVAAVRDLVLWEHHTRVGATVHLLSLSGEPTGSEDLADRTHRIRSLADYNAAPDATAFIACHLDNRRVTQALRKVLADERFINCPFFHKVSEDLSNTALRKFPLNRDTVSTHGDFSDFSEIYERVDQRVGGIKTLSPVAYDLHQMLHRTRNIPGAIVEFGSFQGHSGLFMAETLQSLGVHKRIYMCDRFETFPDENVGVDQFWSGTHWVPFEAVQMLMADHPNVVFVKGDFADTIQTIEAQQYALVFVDCDSYRATRFVAEQSWDKLAVGGVMFFEDYGHSFCVGARVAVDEFMESRRDMFCFQSKFSGVMMCLKTN